MEVAGIVDGGPEIMEGGEEFEEFKGFKEFEVGELGELGEGAECVGNPGRKIFTLERCPPTRVASGACYDANRRHCTLLTGEP